MRKENGLTWWYLRGSSSYGSQLFLLTRGGCMRYPWITLTTTAPTHVPKLLCVFWNLEIDTHNKKRHNINIVCLMCIYKQNKNKKRRKLHLQMFIYDSKKHERQDNLWDINVKNVDSDDLNWSFYSTVRICVLRTTYEQWQMNKRIRPYFEWNASFDELLWSNKCGIFICLYWIRVHYMFESELKYLF